MINSEEFENVLSSGYPLAADEQTEKLSVLMENCEKKQGYRQKSDPYGKCVGKSDGCRTTVNRRKSNEITAVPELLAALDITEKLLRKMR